MIKNALASDRKVVVFLAGTTAAAENFDAGAALQVKLTFNYLWPVPAGRACAAPGGAV